MWRWTHSTGTVSERSWSNNLHSKKNKKKVLYFYHDAFQKTFINILEGHAKTNFVANVEIIFHISLGYRTFVHAEGWTGNIDWWRLSDFKKQSFSFFFRHNCSGEKGSTHLVSCSYVSADCLVSRHWAHWKSSSSLLAVVFLLSNPAFTVKLKMKFSYVDQLAFVRHLGFFHLSQHTVTHMSAS